MRPVRAKALIINAFAITGRIVFGGFLPQGVLALASGRVLILPDNIPHYTLNNIVYALFRSI